MGMMMMVMAAPDRLRQILNVGELPALRGIREVIRQLGELVSRCCIAIRLVSLRGILQVRGDLLSDLPVLGRVRLLNLLEFTQQLGEGRKLGTIRLWLDRRSIDPV